MKTRDVAKAFVEGRMAKCHNARTDGVHYWLHGNCIAEKGSSDARPAVWASWCGWYTQTTARHLNHIADLLGCERVSARNAARGLFPLRVKEQA